MTFINLIGVLPRFNSYWCDPSFQQHHGHSVFWRCSLQFTIWFLLKRGSELPASNSTAIFDIRFSTGSRQRLLTHRKISTPLIHSTLLTPAMLPATQAFVFIFAALWKFSDHWEVLTIDTFPAGVCHSSRAVVAVTFLGDCLRMVWVLSLCSPCKNDCCTTLPLNKTLNNSRLEK